MTQANLDLCQYLGVIADPDTRCTFSFDGHRCYRGRTPEEIPLEHQDRYCLTLAHSRCPYLQPSFAVREQLTRHKPEASSPEPAGSGRPAGGRPTVVVVVGIAAAVLALVLVALGAMTQFGREVQSEPAPPETPTAVQIALVVETPTAGSTAPTEPPASPTSFPATAVYNTPVVAQSITPTGTVTATRPIGTPSPTVRPGASTTPSVVRSAPAWDLRLSGAYLMQTPVTMPTPTASPSSARPTQLPPVVHRVVSGETLSQIAQRYGTTEAAIMAANDIVDRNRIVTGMNLIIPQSP